MSFTGSIVRRILVYAVVVAFLLAACESSQPDSEPAAGTPSETRGQDQAESPSTTATTLATTTSVPTTASVPTTTLVTTTNASATTTPVAAEATTSTTTTVTSTVAPSTTTTTVTTTVPPPREPEFLVSGPDGIFLADSTGAAELLIAGPGLFAIDDLDGGVLFTQTRTPGDSIVYRVRQGTDQAIETLVPAVDQGLSLRGIVRDGSTYVYYSRHEGSGPENTRVTLRRYNLETREVTELGTLAGWHCGTHLSISERLILFNTGCEGEGGYNFSDLVGNGVSVATNPGDWYEGCESCRLNGELSDDGTRLAYSTVVDGSTFAVILDVASSDEIRRIELAAGDEWRVQSFDLTDDVLLVNRWPLAAWVFDLSLANPAPVTLAVPGTAYVTQSAVDIRGVVAAP